MTNVYGAQNFRLAAAGLALVAIAALGLSGCRNFFREEATWNGSLVVPAGAVNLAITTRNGDVSVRAESGLTEVQVSAEVTASGLSFEEAKERAAAVTVTIERAADSGLLSITPVLPGDWQDGDAVALDVRVPTLGAVTVHTSNGALELRGAAGEADLRTSNGAVRLENCAGAVKVRTSNGRITAHQVSGALDVRSSNGRLELHLADGAVGPLTAHSSNGAVRLELPASWTGTLELSTSNGNLQVEDPSNLVKSRNLGDAQGTVEFAPGPGARVSTSNGSIKVVVRPLP